tara:strand:- start:1889 stop:2101 length:213 start_codon:yes stop_codon:yes gene_type:complete
MRTKRKDIRKCGMYYYVYIPQMFSQGNENQLDREDRIWFKKNYERDGDSNNYKQIVEKHEVNIFKEKNNG